MAARVTKSAITLLRPSMSRARCLASSPLLAPSPRAKLPDDFVSFNFSTSRQCHSSSPTPSFTKDCFSRDQKRIDVLEFTVMELDYVLNLILSGWMNEEVVETENFLKVLLEEENGLAGRIYSKAGLNNSSILRAIDDFISKEERKVSRCTAFMVGEHLYSLLENAIKQKKDMEDEIVSVEHFLLAFCLDKRFGQELFTNLGLTEKDLRDAIDDVRGSQKRELNEHRGVEKLRMCKICEGRGIWRRNICIRCGGTGKIEPMIYLAPTQLYAGVIKSMLYKFHPSRLMGIDVGKDGVGVSLSDLRNGWVGPLTLFDRKNQTLVMQARKLETLIYENDVYGLVIGYPYMDNHLTFVGEDVMKVYVNEMSDTGILGGVPYTYSNEAFSSQRADDEILEPYEKRMTPKLRRGARDTYASGFINGDYLQTAQAIVDGKLLYGWKEDFVTEKINLHVKLKKKG